MKFAKFVAGVLFTPLILCAEMRTWTDTQGRSMQAEYLSHDATQVSVKLASNNSICKIDLSKLSKIDQDWVAKQTPAAQPGAKPADDASKPLVWPDSMDPPRNIEVTVVEENEQTQRYAYATENFVFECNAKLGKAAIKDLAKIFEGSLQAVAKLPIPVQRQRASGEKYKAKLFETKEQYHAAGGPPGSGGVYMGGPDHILVPLSSLGLTKVGSQWKFGRGENTHTLVHELSHQLKNPRAIRHPWFIEGIAEYFASSHTGDGKFNFKTNRSWVIEYVTAFGRKEDKGRNLGKEISMPPLRKFCNQTYAEFTAGMANKEDRVNRNYGVALLFTYWIIHMDSEPAKRLRPYLNELVNNPQNALSMGDSAGDKATELLLDGTSWEQLEKDFAAGMRRFGIKIKFDAAN